jgi:hypothetical protein
MDISKKTAQRLNVIKDWGLFKLMDMRMKTTMRAVDRYERSHGFGYEDDYTEADYARFTETDEGFKALWSDQCKALDDWREVLGQFCESMERFTDGQVDASTARKMATTPRYAERLEEIINGKVA